jgi:hypothetical protein
MRCGGSTRRRASADGARRAGALVVALLCLAGGGCGRGERDSTGPGPAALRLFDLARGEEPGPDRLGASFDPVPGEDDRAALLDALSALAPAREPRVVQITRTGGPDDAFVDLEADLAGGGLARYSVRLAEVGPDDWRVRWFQGPGVDWPPFAAGPGEGSRSSAPPAPAH